MAATHIRIISGTLCGVPLTGHDIWQRAWRRGVQAAGLCAVCIDAAKSRMADAGKVPAVLAPALCIDDPTVHRQVRRMLESMREFGFDPGGAWHVRTGDGFESGWTPRVAGDPIFHTIGEVAGVDCTRSEMAEALAAVADGRHPNLPPRMRALPQAIQQVAEALAAGRRIVATEYGSIRIQGPMLPTNWDVADSDDSEVL